MPTRKTLGGIVHTYQRYDPVGIPPPRPLHADMVSAAMEHLLTYGEISELTPEQLADAVEIDPSQIRGLGPSLESLRAMLKERRRKILEYFETRSVQKKARKAFRAVAESVQPPAKFRDQFHHAVKQEQLRELERLWFAQNNDQSRFGVELVGVVDRLADLYQVEELATKWTFHGNEKLDVLKALEVKEELETIELLLKQLEEAAQNAKVALIDMEALGRFAEDGQLDELDRLRRQVQEMIEQMAAEQGLEKSSQGYSLTPKAIGDGSVEQVPTRPYEFGDSVAHMDIPGSLVNTMLRSGPSLPLKMEPRDIEVHKTRNTPKCATTVVLDMSGSMRYGGLYVSVKRMALALHGLVTREYPGDSLQFIEMYSFAKVRTAAEIVQLMPKPVSIFDSVVRLRADMSDPAIVEQDVPAHFTNIQHALQLSRRHMARQDTPNRQVIIITDGLPTAHFEGSQLFLLYPPHARTEEATLREARACHREGITVNIFLLSGWSQSREDIQFAYRLAQSAQGRVFFTAGKELDRFVVWDYVRRRRSIIG